MNPTEHKYKYICPIERGYIKVPISKRRLSKFKLGYFKTNVFEKYEVYYNPESKRYEIDKFKNWLFITLSIILFPLSLIMNGLWNWKETVEEHVRLFNQKKSGRFYSESFMKGKYLEFDEFVDGMLNTQRTV